MFATHVQFAESAACRPPDLLLPELHVCIEHGIVELLLIARHAALDLLLIQQLVQHGALTIAELPCGIEGSGAGAQLRVTCLHGSRLSGAHDKPYKYICPQQNWHMQDESLSP